MQSNKTNLTGDIRVGVDIGGTFTDLVLVRDNVAFVNKISSTPDDPGVAVVDGLQQLFSRLEVDPSLVREIVHGTTVGSNTLLQRVGARTGLITTKGFRDILEIGRIRTPEMFNLAWEKPEALAYRRHRREVTERVGADGSVIAPLDCEEVRSIGRELVADGVEAIAICFINSYKNPEHEALAARILRETFPDVRVTASHEVLPEIKEYERTSTTIVNAYLLPQMQAYIEGLIRSLRDIGVRAPLQVMASNGGMIGANKAATTPVYAVASGPAGGVTGAAALTLGFGYGDLIVFDMGGTTAKAAIVENGKPSLVTEYEFRDGITSPSRFIKGGGYMLSVPSVDIAEVGAGGGSLATIDSGGLLTVGPASAGADPGPACYGRGSEHPTVTDANVCLGFLNPQALAGGSLAIHQDRAHEAIAEHIATPLGLSTINAAHGIRQIANVNMARALRSVTVERGKDPRDMAISAFGGGGPLHAVDIARLLGVQRVIVPTMSGVFSAAGMLGADIKHDFVRASYKSLSELTLDWFAEHAEGLAQQAREELSREGYAETEIDLHFTVDLRYAGQSSELGLPFAVDVLSESLVDDLPRHFNAEYRATYGYATDEDVELANLRLTAIGRSDRRLHFDNISIDATAVHGETGTRKVYFERGADPVDTTLIARADVTEQPVAGPVIIESYDTTIAIPGDCTFRADTVGNIVVDLPN